MLRENYDCELSGCPAGSDGLHPNALGDYQIAQAFSNTLVNDFGIGRRTVEIPADVPFPPLPVPSNFKVVASPGGTLATWDPVYGAYTYDVRSRIEGFTDWSMGSTGTNRNDGTWILDNVTYSYQVRATRGDRTGGWTDVRSVLAHPQTAPGPRNVKVTSTPTGFDISFDPPTGPFTDHIVEYNIIFWDRDTHCAFITGAAFKSSPAHIDGLNPGHRYLVAPVTYNAAGGGIPEIVHDVMVGAGTPGTPSGFQVFSNDPTSVHATWDQTPSAAGYTVYIQDINNSSRRGNGTNTDTCFDDYFLFPGTWNYKFAISAYNGNAESTRTKWITAPHPIDGAPQNFCPASPPWCPELTNPTSGGGGGDGTSMTTTITTTGLNGKPTTATETLGELESSQPLIIGL